MVVIVDPAIRTDRAELRGLVEAGFEAFAEAAGEPDASLLLTLGM